MQTAGDGIRKHPSHRKELKNLITALKSRPRRAPKPALAFAPVFLLLVSITLLIALFDATTVQEMSQWLLLGYGLLAGVLAVTVCRCPLSELKRGLRESGRQIVPCIPILLLIGTISSTWMLSGIVPMLIDIGLHVINPTFFLLTACVVCSLISVLTGSSWTTIATIGVALMGVGIVMGYSPGWVAGAIISGAYFGDKISPLSDTTVLASSSCGVDLFRHIRYMMLTTVPSIAIALGVFGAVGVLGDFGTAQGTDELTGALEATFNLTPWLLAVPAVTAVLIAVRANTYMTLSVSSLLGLAAMFIFQPGVTAMLGAETGSAAATAVRVLGWETGIETGSELLDSLVSTGGMAGMLSTVTLVTCAMIFGGMMIGSGMLASITELLTRRLRTARSSVSATVASGLVLNGCTGDQFLSIIVSSNIYKPIFEKNGLDRPLLSRTVEDSVSVTSVLIPWNSCGLTQATVLSVPTLVYFPYCIFNLVSPLMSLAMAWAGIKIRQRVTAA